MRYECYRVVIKGYGGFVCSGVGEGGSLGGLELAVMFFVLGFINWGHWGRFLFIYAYLLAAYFGEYPDEFFISFTGLSITYNFGETG